MSYPLNKFRSKVCRVCEYDYMPIVGNQKYCDECRPVVKKNYYQNHREACIKRAKRWYEKNKDKAKEYSRKNYYKNRDKLLAQKKARYLKKKNATHNKTDFEVKLRDTSTQ